MTAPADRDVHPDVDEISDLTEDLLSPERSAEVRAHIESCALCGETLASLQEIQRLLGDQLTDEPMPAAVVARIDAALAAEVGQPAHVPRETSAPPTPRPAADVSRGTSAPAGRPPAPTGPGRAGRRVRGLQIAVASSAAVLALGWVTYQLAQHDGSGDMKADSSAKRSDAQAGSGTGSSTTVGDQVARLLEGAGSPSKDGGANTPLLTPNGTTVTAPNGTVTAIPACVVLATRRTQQPLAAQRESYQGVDSYLVVLSDPADPTVVDAFVVNASCTGTSPGGVLFQNSYPRR